VAQREAVCVAMTTAWSFRPAPPWSEAYPRSTHLQGQAEWNPLCDYLILNLYVLLKTLMGRFGFGLDKNVIQDCSGILK
jgi:hypothetical protein